MNRGRGGPRMPRGAPRGGGPFVPRGGGNFVKRAAPRGIPSPRSRGGFVPRRPAGIAPARGRGRAMGGPDAPRGPGGLSRGRGGRARGRGRGGNSFFDSYENNYPDRIYVEEVLDDESRGGYGQESKREHPSSSRPSHPPPPKIGPTRYSSSHRDMASDYDRQAYRYENNESDSGVRYEQRHYEDRPHPHPPRNRQEKDMESRERFEEYQRRSVELRKREEELEQREREHSRHKSYEREYSDYDDDYPSYAAPRSPARYRSPQSPVSRRRQGEYDDYSPPPAPASPKPSRDRDYRSSREYGDYDVDEASYQRDSYSGQGPSGSHRGDRGRGRGRGGRGRGGSYGAVDAQECHICRMNNHSTQQCRKKNHRSPEELLQITRDNRLCRACFGPYFPNHNQQCPVLCERCGGHHLSRLHDVVQAHEHEIAAKRAELRDSQPHGEFDHGPKKRPFPAQGSGERGGPPMKRGRGRGRGSVYRGRSPGESDSRVSALDRLGHKSGQDSENRPGFIKLRCPHCKMDIKTFAEFQKHLTSPEHTTSMQQLKQRLQVTLARMRKKQRNQQHELEKVLDEEGKNVDEETGEKLAPIYCKVCKLVFHQKRIEHNASEMHRLINDFLNPRCSVCDTDYFSPMAYERHIATLQHIRRRAESDVEEKDKDLQQVVEEMDDEQFDMDNFMTLDEVGEVEDVDEEGKAEEAAEGQEGKGRPETSDEEVVKREKEEPPPPPERIKVDPDDPVGDEYIRIVEMFYCDLCHKFLPRCSLDKSEHVRRTHCLSKAHQDAYCEKKERERDAATASVKDEVKEEPEEEGYEAAADDDDAADGEAEEEEGTQGRFEEEDDDEEEEDDDDTYNKRRLNRREDDDVLELDYEGEGSLTGD